MTTSDREYLNVQGIGNTRDCALEHADKQARQYFDLTSNQSNPLTRSVGRAHALTTTYDGSVQAWSVDVEYRWPL